MKKTSTSKSRGKRPEDMQPEYDFDYRKAKPNRFTGRISKERVVGKSNQRPGSVSNSQVGAAFECVALDFFAKQGIKLTRNFPVDLGLSRKKVHCFDLGASDPRVIVECKSHRWTAGANVPSAKMTIWNEAMYYFHLAPKEFRKVLFVLHDRRSTDGESLLKYYKRTYFHMIPEGVEFLEWDEVTGDIIKL